MTKQEEIREGIAKRLYLFVFAIGFFAGIVGGCCVYLWGVI